MNKVFLIIVLCVFLISSTVYAADEEKFVQLRDEGIENTGWVAGNSYGHPIWPEVKPYLGEDGEYYNFFVRLAPKNSNHQTEAIHNVSLYKESFKKGHEHPFDENEANLRTQRILQIIQEIGTLLK